MQYIRLFILIIIFLGFTACGGGNNPDKPDNPEIPVSSSVWKTKTPLPMGINESIAIATADKIYLVGGYSEDGANNHIFIYDPQSDSWQEGTNLFFPVNHHNAVLVNDKIYVFSAKFDTQIYHIASNTWEVGTALPSDLIASSATVNGQNIHVIGGADDLFDGTPSSLHHVYQTETDTWVTAADLPTAREHAGSLEVAGKIYVFGGKIDPNNINVLEVFDPITNQWSSLQGMLTARSAFSFAALNGSIYVFGGEDETTMTTSINGEKYSISTHQWSSTENLTSARYGAAAVTFGNSIYLFGGSKMVGFFTSDQVEVFTPTTH